MRRTWESWLVKACDPQTPAAAPRRRLSAVELTAALAAAKRHFVLGSVLQSLDAWRYADSLELANAIRPHAESYLRDAGRTLALRLIADQTIAALGAAGVPCCVLKGKDFAERLYPKPTLRPYRDVDLLVPRQHYATADAVIKSLGFAAVDPERKYAAEDYGQISYFATSPEQWALELHWNVINSPAQRRQCSIAWEDLEFEPQQPPAQAVGLRRLTSTSLLILAGVHACVGHRFDSLQQLCDIRQICRGAAGPVDADQLVEACRRLRCETPVAWSLDLVRRMFACSAARDLLARCRFSQRVARPWGVLGRQTVLRPTTPASKARRSLARLRLKNAA
jgi:hypothetical protein